MFTFTFDERYFFDRSEHDACWYAQTHPKLNQLGSPEFAHGYFRVTDGCFDHHCTSGSPFSSEQIQKVETLLGANIAAMDLRQFNVHRTMPSHYRRIEQGTNRYKDVIRRMRVYGMWDPDFTVALEHLALEQPAYRLTTSFANLVLERAANVTQADRMECILESSKDSWTYDHSGYAEPGETFEAFLEAEIKLLDWPTPVEARYKEDQYRIYEVIGVEGLYYAQEPITEELFHGRYFWDRGQVLSPVTMPGYGSEPYYILD